MPGVMPVVGKTDGDASRGFACTARPVEAGGVDPFVGEVVPELQKRGLYRGDCTGTTLRDHLGIPRPAMPPR